MEWNSYWIRYGIFGSGHFKVINKFCAYNKIQTCQGVSFCFRGKSGSLNLNYCLNSVCDRLGSASKHKCWALRRNYFSEGLDFKRKFQVEGWESCVQNSESSKVNRNTMFQSKLRHPEIKYCSEATIWKQVPIILKGKSKINKRKHGPKRRKQEKLLCFSHYINI